MENFAPAEPGELRKTVSPIPLLPYPNRDRALNTGQRMAVNPVTGYEKARYSGGKRRLIAKCRGAGGRFVVLGSGSGWLPFPAFRKVRPEVGQRANLRRVAVARQIGEVAT